MVISRRYLSVFAIALLAASSAALAFEAIVSTPPGAQAKKKKRKPCAVGKEKQGCKLPQGAVFSGSTSTANVQVGIGTSGATLEAGGSVTCNGEPANTSGIGRAGGKAKVGGTLTFAGISESEEGNAAGTVKFLSAKKAKASLTVGRPGDPCQATIEMILDRE